MTRPPRAAPAHRGSGGRLRVLGQELSGAGPGWRTAARRDIGFVFQDPAASFDPKLTIGESIAEPIRVHDGAGRRDARRRADALLESVLLRPEHAQRYPHELSGVIDGLADTVGVLHHGKLVEYGGRYQVLTHPRHDYTRQLIAASPVPDPAEQAARRAARG